MSDPAARLDQPAETIRLRPALKNLPAYVAGKPAADDGIHRFKVSSNESHLPPIPSVRDAAVSAMESSNRYPDASAQQLRAALGRKHGVDPAQIALSTGAVAVTGDLVRALVGEGDEVVFAWRSFEAYPILVGSHGGTPVPVPLTAEGEHDLEAMAAAVTERTRLVLLCTPNNPTGPILTTEEVEGFLAQVPPHVLVVIDEAYLEFIRDEGAVDGIEMYRRHQNVVVLRTFSKAHGLANLRVGYSVSRPHITQYLRVIATPFAVSSLAERSAVASLDHLDQVMERVDQVVSERERVVQGLQDAGWDVPDTQANFVWLPLGERTPEFVAAAERQALSVRGFGTEGVRVSIGEVEANTRFLELVRAFGA